MKKALELLKEIWEWALHLHKQATTQNTLVSTQQHVKNTKNTLKKKPSNTLNKITQNTLVVP